LALGREAEQYVDRLIPISKIAASRFATATDIGLTIELRNYE
jgi:hypothetical protein